MNTTRSVPSPYTTPATSASGKAPLFAATHWSVVLTAARSDTPRAHAALENLCRTYWPPLYTYVRRRGYSPEDAQDLTQEFFARLLRPNVMTRVHPDKGRFRSFLLASMNHFLADEWDRSRAQKRGGGQVIVMDLQSAEAQLADLRESATPENAFDRRWTITLLEQVYRRLEDEHRTRGKLAQFRVLRATLAGMSDSTPYAILARELGISEGAIKVAVHRLRQRYRMLLREAISETVADPAEIEDELRCLFRILART